MSIPIDVLVNDFAVRCFLEVADRDYITARLTYRAGLAPQFLWASQQAVEKYLKYMLLMHRIPAAKVGHNLSAAISKIQASGKLILDLTDGTKHFIDRLDQCGQYRYFEVSNHVFGRDLITLDRSIWEVRRYCKMESESASKRLQEGVVAPRVLIEGGYLEQVIGDRKHPAREALIWQNGFFGRRRRFVRSSGNAFTAHNSPLWLHPQIVDEVLRYVYLPERIAEAYRQLAREKIQG